LGFCIGHWIYLTHRLKYLWLQFTVWCSRQFTITLYIELSLFHTQSAWSSLNTHWLLLICCPSLIPLVPASNGKRSPFPGFRTVSTPQQWQFLTHSALTGTSSSGAPSCHWVCPNKYWNTAQVQVQVTLWPTVSQSWHQAPHLGPWSDFLLVSDIYSLHVLGRLSWWEDGSVIYSYNLLSLSCPIPTELMTSYLVISLPTAEGTHLHSHVISTFWWKCRMAADTVYWNPEVEVNLRLTVSRPVCLGVGLPSGAHDQIFVFYLTIVGFLMWGTLSDERMDL
jgi:hypothetical protein